MASLDTGTSDRKASYAKLRVLAEEAWQRARPRNKPWVTVGLGWCGLNNGARETLEALRATAAQKGLEVVIDSVGCNGMCYAEPVVEVSLPGRPVVTYGPVRAQDVERFVEEVLVQGSLGLEWAIGVHADRALEPIPPLRSLDFFRQQERRVMARCGVINPEEIDHAIALGAYEGLERALAMTPEAVLQEMRDSGLGGRGGGFFVAGQKWGFLRNEQRHPKFIVCNADEGDPGAFVNRVILEGDPHSVIEGMLIAAYATDAEQGIIYIRSEYPLAVERVRLALRQAEERGLVGDHILGTEFSCAIQLVVGAGSYVAGEETGLIASVDEGRAMPRIKPPFPANAGVFQLPTNVNNTETYANAPLIIARGAQWFRSVGTERNPGTKMFSLTGHIKRMGVVEVPMGISLRVLIEEMGGGTPNGRPLKAIQPGGPLSGVLPASDLDIALEPAPFTERGLLMGSGGLIALDDSTCMVDLARLYTIFNQVESCARCTTCRIGTMRLVDILERAVRGEHAGPDLTNHKTWQPGDTDHIAFLHSVLQNSNCLHGRFSAYMINSVLRFFREEFAAHIDEQRCPAKVCRELIRYEIVPERGAEVDPDVCPVGAIKRQGADTWIDDELCIRCGICARLSPPGAVQVTDAVRAAPLF